MANPAGPARMDAQDASPRRLGRYRLYGELASGGMATVHLGRQLGSDGFSRVVAIKRLHPQYCKQEDFVAQFVAEARLAARIRHPNVVQPLDVLRVDDEVFLVMEYMEGDSLARLVKATTTRQEKVPAAVAVTIIGGVLRGLHAAHEAKSDRGDALEIIHRDVSPQNILVGVDGTPRVIDFGIAKAASSAHLTQEGHVRGKLPYIAPEVLEGKPATRRSDVYAAAVVLWEVVTGQRLFDAETESAILVNVLRRPVEPPSRLVDGLPPGLDEVILRGLTRRPSDRYATARDMALALEAATPLASAAVVSAWVEAVGAAPLEHRARRVAQIEAGAADEVEVVEAEEVLSELICTTDEAGRAPPPAPTPPRPVPARGEPDLPRRPTPGAPPPPTIIVDEKPAPADVWPPVPSAPPKGALPVEPRSRSSGSWIVALTLLSALLLSVSVVGLPEVAKRVCTAAAARQGVALTIGSAKVSWGQVRLGEVEAKLFELPRVSIRAYAVDISLSPRLAPTGVTAHELVVSVDGPANAVRDDLRKFVAARDPGSWGKGSLRQLTVDSGHLIWSGAFGDGTTLELENVALDASREADAPTLDGAVVGVPIVVVSAPWGKLGPWSATANLAGGVARATLSFDPSGASKAALSVALDAGAISSLDLTLPRSEVGLLGVGAASRGRRPEELTFVEGEAHYAARGPSRVEGSARLEMSGARLTGALGGADAHLDLHLDGDPSRPLEIGKGGFSFGPFRGTAGGRLTLGDGFVKADISLRTGASRCPTGADVALGGTLSFDTRSLADARLAVTPSGRCGTHILPP